MVEGDPVPQAARPLKLDAFPHILPRAYLERARELYPRAHPPATLALRPSLHDVDDRLRVMDRFEGYAQVLTLASPPVESLGDGGHASELARLANEGMSELCRRWPDRFLGFAAALPLHDPDLALRDLDDALALGALGVQIHTNTRGAAWDEPRFAPFFARMAELDRPIWVHPARTAAVPDYAGETAAKYGTFIAFGWPYETAVFMTRLVFSGILDRHPGLRILTHHAGGLIPSFAQRLEKGVESGGGRADAVADMKRFFGDTALNGNLAAVQAGLAFFGVERLLFGTDMPYDDEDGVAYVRDTIANVEALPVSEAERSRIYSGNAARVLGVTLPAPGVRA